jgi:hypothetical protein
MFCYLFLLSLPCLMKSKLRKELCLLLEFVMYLHDSILLLVVHPTGKLTTKAIDEYSYLEPYVDDDEALFDNLQADATDAAGEPFLLQSLADSLINLRSCFQMKIVRSWKRWFDKWLTQRASWLVRIMYYDIPPCECVGIWLWINRLVQQLMSIHI